MKIVIYFILNYTYYQRLISYCTPSFVLSMYALHPYQKIRVVPSCTVYRVPCTVYSYSNGDSSPNYFGEIGLTIWNSNLINQGVMFKHRALDQFLVKHGSSNGGGFLVVLYGYLQLWQMFTQEDTVCRENQFQKGGTCAHSNPFSITTKIIRRINLK